MSWTNEKTADTLGKQIARRFFAARGNNTEVHINEAELALICKLAFEVGVQSGIKAAKEALER